MCDGRAECVCSERSASIACRQKIVLLENNGFSNCFIFLCSLAIIRVDIMTTEGTLCTLHCFTTCMRVEMCSHHSRGNKYITKYINKYDINIFHISNSSSFFFPPSLYFISPYFFSLCRIPQNNFQYQPPSPL